MQNGWRHFNYFILPAKGKLSNVFTEANDLLMNYENT